MVKLLTLNFFHIIFCSISSQLILSLKSIKNYPVTMQYHACCFLGEIFAASDLRKGVYIYWRFNWHCRSYYDNRLRHINNFELSGIYNVTGDSSLALHVRHLHFSLELFSMYVSCASNYCNFGRFGAWSSWSRMFLKIGEPGLAKADATPGNHTFFGGHVSPSMLCLLYR
jgi:hypothetical protein